MSDHNTIIAVFSLIASMGIMAAAAIGACLGDAKVTKQFIEGLSRQPEAKDTLFTNMLISVGLVESMAIIATVVVLILLFANPFLAH